MENFEDAAKANDIVERYKHERIIAAPFTIQEGCQHLGFILQLHEQKMERIEYLEAKYERLQESVERWFGLSKEEMRERIEKLSEAEAQLALLVGRLAGDGYCHICSMHLDDITQPLGKNLHDKHCPLANLPTRATELMEKAKEYDEIMLIAFENHRGNVADHRDRLARDITELKEEYHKANKALADRIVVVCGENERLRKGLERITRIVVQNHNGYAQDIARCVLEGKGIWGTGEAAPEFQPEKQPFYDYLMNNGPEPEPAYRKAKGSDAALSPAPAPGQNLIVHDKGCPFREQRGECTCKPAPEQEPKG